jgi:hypothetical protein
MVHGVGASIFSCHGESLSPAFCYWEASGIELPVPFP